MSSRKIDACKATSNLHFLVPQRTKKNGVMEKLLFWGLAFLWGFFGLHLHEINNISLTGD